MDVAVLRDSVEGAGFAVYVPGTALAAPVMKLLRVVCVTEDYG